MIACVINSFIFEDKKTLNSIYNYIKTRYNDKIIINDVKLELRELIKTDIIYYNDDSYELTEKGRGILNDHKYYYSRKIIEFYKKYNKIHKKYELREIREEQQGLRNYLINNKEQRCILCNKFLPMCLLETAHLKPRNILNYREKKDVNVVEFMCRYCHSLYDNGLLSVYNGLLHISSAVDIYDLNFNNKEIISYNAQNEKYFSFHYNYIFRNLKTHPSHSYSQAVVFPPHS
jgi:hypothetical protein